MDIALAQSLLVWYVWRHGSGHSELPCSRISRHVGPHVIQDKCVYTWLNWLSTSRIPIELWPINHCQDPRTLKTNLITVTLPSYKKNVRVLSRRLSRAPSKLRAVSHNKLCSNMANKWKIHTSKVTPATNWIKYSIELYYKYQKQKHNINTKINRTDQYRILKVKIAPHY